MRAVLVGGERDLEIVFADELLVLLHRVARHADDLHASLREIGGERGEVLRFAGAARRVVLGIEIKHQRLAGRGEVDRAAVACGRANAGALSPSSIISSLA